jgi:uncharacterized protein DUF4266
VTWVRRAWLLSALAAVACALGCARVRPWQRERLASPAMQFQVDAQADAQTQSIREITEGGTFAGGGAGSAGAGCGCH